MLSWSWCPTCWNCWEGEPNMRLRAPSRVPRFALLTLVGGLLIAQTPQPSRPAPSAQQPTSDNGQPIRVSVENVVVPTLVFTRDGGFVSGLRPDQFRLFDNNKEQNIQV